MAAMSAKQHNPDKKKMFDRLEGAGKTHKVAATAAVRKPVMLANVLLGQQRRWERTAPPQAV